MVTGARRDAKPDASALRDAGPEKETETEAGFDFELAADIDPDALPPSVQHPKDKFTIEAVCSMLKATSGIVTLTAQRLGCERKTVYRYADRYWEVKAAMQEAEEVTLDFAEGKLKELMRGNNVATIIFYLKTKGKARGYSERHEVSGPGGGPVSVKLDVEQTRSDILGDLRRIAQRGGARRVAEPAHA